MKKLLYTIGIIIPLFLPRIAFAASNTEVDKFAGDAMTAILALAGTAAVFFLIRGGGVPREWQGKYAGAPIKLGFTGFERILGLLEGKP